EVHEDVDQDPENGQQRPHAAVVPLLQELRHSKDPLLQIDGQKEPGYDEECNGRHPLIAGYRQAETETRAGHSDELLGGNVGSDEGRTNSPPGKRLTRQEVILSVFPVSLLLARYPEADADDDGAVQTE